MRILGIDPGTNNLGYAVIEVKNKKLHLLVHGVFKLQKLPSHQEKLHQIFLKVQRIIDGYKPQEMAIEAPFYGKNVQSMLKLGRAQGVAIAAALDRKLAVQEYSPKKIKVAVTGNGNASKEQVAALVDQLIVNDIDVSLLDATDALAAAICHHFQNKSLLGAGKNYKDWSSFIKDNGDRIN
ncbi:MAG: crossover junction endodeoxyribonuclease RuvC [Saprospiraceae bacterium]|nr:crossover junction endodeoxyribonuclease RuvC [Saprospiraceae bacterium]